MKASNRQSAGLERAVGHVERSLDLLFTAGRYHDFFTLVHQTREAIKSSQHSFDARRLLWDRLNRCSELAKARQEREFAERNAANLARWREVIAVAERYTTALNREITELKGRAGSNHERALWQRRIAEKEARLADVRANVDATQLKITDVIRRQRR